MTLRAILFDIDDTLFPTTVFSERARRRAVDAMVHAGLRVEAEAAYQELEQVVQEFSSNYGHHFDKLVLRLSEHLREGVHPAIVIASGVCAYHATKEHIKPYPDAVRALDALSRSSLLRGVLTNGLTVKQAEKLVRLGLESAFSSGAIFISEEIGVAKPHPKIFLIACEHLGIAPGEALYVGDHPVKDVDPAHEAGLITCLRQGDGKHRGIAGTHAPDITVDNLDQLVTILRGRYGVVCGR
ncbi:MAG: TIGR02253 family HAD-type hydrolase [Planctomycetota bacterium]|jgi:putative hydrolase of the HAD superfamily